MIPESLRALIAESATSNFSRISELSERLADMIRQLRVFVRPASQQPPEALPLMPRIDFALELLADRITALGLTIERDEHMQNISVMGEQVRLEQLLTNLIRNAVDALEQQQNKELTVKTPRLALSWQAHEQAPYLEDQPGGCLRIQDNGPGIDPELRDTLFDPFTTTREVGDGMGMGLFLSYGLARDLGGLLRLAEGTTTSSLRGACFELWLRTPTAAGATESDVATPVQESTT